MIVMMTMMWPKNQQDASERQPRGPYLKIAIHLHHKKKLKKLLLPRAKNQKRAGKKNRKLKLKTPLSPTVLKRKKAKRKNQKKK
jgi:hypothetical protein